MKKFIQLPENLREALATQAGIMLTDFDPEAPADAETIRANILFATTGGVNPTCVANYTDFGEDVDNCPKNVKYCCTAWRKKRQNIGKTRAFGLLAVLTFNDIVRRALILCAKGAPKITLL